MNRRELLMLFQNIVQVMNFLKVKENSLMSCSIFSAFLAQTIVMAYLL